MPYPPRTHCKNGHEFTKDNLYMDGSKGRKESERRCLTCKREKGREYQRRRKTRERGIAPEPSPLPETKPCIGCGRDLREGGTPRVLGTVVEHRDSGMCGSCARYGPPKLDRDLALVAVEIARDERWPVEPLEEECQMSDTSA